MKKQLKLKTMSYSSRVYRQRNPKVQEEKKGKAFFPGKESRKAKNSDSFFQAKLNTPEDSAEKQKEEPMQTKMADQEKEREVNIPKQGDPLKEKETTIQKKAEDDKKDIKKKSEPVEEKDQDKPNTTS